MNNKSISELSFFELSLLDELRQRYELLATLINDEGLELTNKPVHSHHYNDRLVKHRLEVYYGLVKS